jgi:hypothetical protein
MKYINIFLILLCLFISQVSAQYKDSKNHSHKSIEAKMPYPSVDIRVIKDAKSGYNIQLITKNFKFAPEKVNKENVMNEGHAHIYINGVKNRVYSEWYHVEDEKLTQPINQIRATLNANDHSEYAVNSRPIEAIGAIKNENIDNWYNNKK